MSLNTSTLDAHSQAQRKLPLLACALGAEPRAHANCTAQDSGLLATRLPGHGWEEVTLVPTHHSLTGTITHGKRQQAGSEDRGCLVPGALTPVLPKAPGLSPLDTLQMQAGAVCDQLWLFLQKLPPWSQENSSWGELTEPAQQAPSQVGRKLIRLLAQNACCPARPWAEEGKEVR